MRKGLFFILGLILSASCNSFSNLSPHPDPEEDSCEQLNWLANIPRPEINSDTLDASRFYDRWKIISNMDTNLVDLLFLCRADTNLVILCNEESFRLGFDDMRTTVWSVGAISTVSVEVCALHFICALFHDDYYFSSSRELYFERDAARITKNSADAYLLLNNKVVIDSAWQYVLNWHVQMSGKSLPEIRNSKRPPLENSGIKWLGEPGCTVIPSYPKDLQKKLTWKRSGTIGVRGVLKVDQ